MVGKIQTHVFLTLYHTDFFFTFLQHKSFENTVGKVETADNGQFLLLPQCFQPIWRTFCNLHEFMVDSFLQHTSVR